MGKGKTVVTDLVEGVNFFGNFGKNWPEAYANQSIKKIIDSGKESLTGELLQVLTVEEEGKLSRASRKEKK